MKIIIAKGILKIFKNFLFKSRVKYLSFNINLINNGALKRSNQASF